MTFPNLPIDTTLLHLEQSFAQGGTDVDIQLRDGRTFTIKMVQTRLREEDLTEGMTQQGYRMRVLASQWDAEAGRSPEKGDQLTIWGRRHAVENWMRRGIGERLAMYILIIRG